MAKLYGSMAGARTAGLVGHDEMITQLQTWKGVVRTWIDENGDFEVYIADDQGENGLKLIEGNVNQRTVQDAAGNTLNVSPLSTKLDPIVVKNRGKQYTKAQQQKAAQAAAARPQAAARTRKAPTPTTKRTPAKPQQMPSQKAAQQKAAKKKTRAAGPPKRTSQPAYQGPPGFNVSKFKVGDLVVLKHTEDAKYPVNVNTQGVIDKIRQRSPLGPQVVVDWNIHGAATVYPNSGDVIEKVK